MASRSVQPVKRKTVDVTDLLDTERIFCAEYVANGCRAGAAAKIAYPGCKNPSRHAGLVLGRPRVKAYLGRMLQHQLAKADLTAERILRQLELALFLDPLEVFEATDIEGVYRVKALDDIPQEIRQCISELKCKTVEDALGLVTTYFEVKFIGKAKALELAMQYAGLLKETGININASKVTINFDQLAEGGPDDPDTVEGRIAEVA